MNLTRIWEILTGRPHQHQNAQMVQSATDRLLMSARGFVNRVQPYSDDPVDLMFDDIDRQRKATRNESKLHS